MAAVRQEIVSSLGEVQVGNAKLMFDKVDKVASTGALASGTAPSHPTRHPTHDRHPIPAIYIQVDGYDLHEFYLYIY